MQIGRLLPAALVGLALAAAGCGGQSAEQKRRAFLLEANNICGNFEKLQNAVTFPTANPLDPKLSNITRSQWGLALNQIVNYGRQEVRGLQRLKAPKDLRPGYQQLGDVKSAAFDLLAEAADAAKRNHPGAIAAPSNKAKTKLAQASKLAKKLALPNCV